MSQQQDIEKKLRTLYDLQLIDSLVDEIKSIMDSIPLQVRAIENDVENVKTKYKEIRKEIEKYDKAIQQEKDLIKEDEIFIKKYAYTSKGKVRNNIEFEYLSKEIEYKELEIELCHKKWKKFKVKKDKKNKFYANFAALYEKKKEYLSNKKKEFDKILEIQEKKKNLLLKKKESYILSEIIEPSLLQIYNRIRSITKLAIVPIERGAPRGSFFTIPTQKCLEIAQRNSIIMDEHSGRILIDPVLAEEESLKILNIFKDFIK